MNDGIGRADAGLQPAFAAYYDELRQLARRELRHAAGQSLNATALVHEVYLRVAGSHGLDGSRRGSFLALAAKAMRYALVDHVRAKDARKRGGGLVQVTLLTDVPIAGDDDAVDVLAVEQGLQALEQFDARMVAVVECRFFAGMEFDEIAAHLGVSERTAQRDWRRARAFLLSHLDAPG